MATLAGPAGDGDWWGRALWGLGTAAARSPLSWLREAAAARFDVSVGQRSPHLHAMAFAALGAAEMLTVMPGAPRRARPVVRDRVADRPAGARDRRGRGPQPRLTYANAAIAEALIAAGAALGDDRRCSPTVWRCSDGCSTSRPSDGHLSVTPVGRLGAG